MGKPKILLIGWDAADWQIINPLLDSGKMPALASIVNGGVIGNIATLEPVISPILWNSIATGKMGDKHGILGFTETAGMGNVRPVLSTSRTTKAIWNILQQNNYKAHQIGWWASHPAEKLNGISVSEFYGKIRVDEGKIVPAPVGSVHPNNYHEIFNSFRISPTEITGAHLLPFVPQAEKIDQSKDFGLIKIAESLAECTNYHAVATWVLENEEWDFMALYQMAIDTICHKFIRFMPPQLKGIADNDYEIYQHVVEGIYLYHDMMLERVLKLAGPDVTVILVSDHGFNSGDQRLLANPNEPAAIAYDHRPYGIFCAKGPGIKKDERVYGASLLDVAPTILSMCNLPVGMDMDGKALVQIFEDPKSVESIESWDKVEGDSGMYKNTEKPQHSTSGEELRQLIDLGYIEDPGDDIQAAVEKSSRETRFNLGRIYMHTNRFEKAAEVFEELSKSFPDEPRFKVRLASVYQRIGKNEKCQKIIEDLYQLDEENKHKEDKKANSWRVPVSVLKMLEANNLLAQNKPLMAVEMFNTLEREMPSNPKVNIQKARAFEAMLKYTSAMQEYTKSLDKDPDNATAMVGLANCHLVKGKYEEAAEVALDAVGRTYFYPRAHYIIGQALYSLGEYENAINAFEVCLHQNPGLGKARNQLINIYKNHIENSHNLDKHLNYFKKGVQNSVVVVSGIPRSGTSLMMQILETSGLTILTDGERKADKNNPKGYYEFERAKRLAVDNSWLKDAQGKAVKIISQLLFHLPDELNYKVVFMLRDMKEIIHSQQKMIAKLKNIDMPDVYPTHLELAYQKNIEKVENWQKLRSNVEIQYIQYSNMVNNPEEQIALLNTFLGTNLNIGKAKGVIDVNLYRSKF